MLRTESVERRAYSLGFAVQLNSRLWFLLVSVGFAAACGSGNDNQDAPGDSDSALSDSGDPDDGPGDGTGDSLGDVDGADSGDGDGGDLDGDTGGDVTATAPTFDTQPQDQSVVEGTTATFSVVVSGTPTPTLAWETSDDSGATWTAVAGATAASYTTPVTTLGQNGRRLRAVATNSAGAATSNTATLTVTAAPTVGNLVISSPTRIIDEIGGNLASVPAPNGAVRAVVLSAGGRIILEEDSGTANKPSLVSVLPNGTGRVVLYDATSAPGAVTGVSVIAVTPNDVVYYREQRDTDVWVGSVESDGSNPVGPVQLTGGSTGATNLTFYGLVQFNDEAVYRRYTLRIFTEGLHYSLYNGADQLGVYVLSPSLTAGTIFTATPNLYESVCGVIGNGVVVYTRLRTAGVFEVADVYASDSGRLNPEAETDVYNCQVTARGHVIVHTQDVTNSRDLFLADGGMWSPVATTSNREQYVGEANNGAIVYLASDPVSDHAALHVWNAGDDTTLFAMDDSAGPFGGLIAVHPDASRLIAIRSQTFGGPFTLFSIRLDGTGRLTLLPESSAAFRSYEPFGVTASGRFVYRGVDFTSSPRLYSARTDVVVSPGVPNQVMLQNDPNVSLVLLLD